MTAKKISLLTPNTLSPAYRPLSEVTFHDLGLDTICKRIAKKPGEETYIAHVLSQMSDIPEITRYRCDIFEDIYTHPDMCEQIMHLMDQISFIHDYGAFRKNHDDSASTWDMLHRLSEVQDYITCIEGLYHSLLNRDLKSQGLQDLKNYIQTLYEDQGFAALKEDITNIRATTSDLKSVTVGINLNERFEAQSIGLISINNKSFTKSNILSNFVDKIVPKDKISDTTDWDDNYKYHPFSATQHDLEGFNKNPALFAAMSTNPLATLSLAAMPKGDIASDVTSFMSGITNSLLASINRRLKDILRKYVFITITDITDLIPEFLYYIRWADYIRELTGLGYSFCKPLVSETLHHMEAKDIYNLKLAQKRLNVSEIITNDLDFSSDHMIYVLTGANRGGKTTITQAIGQLFVLAQGGIYVPGTGFSFTPADMIYTHFPADEDKTMDLGRLGEECQRFKELYFGATKHSLLLLNETFSTTSFEEGYYIALDALKAIRQKGIRTIYNTHMHKLAYDIDTINQSNPEKGLVASLIVQTKANQRSYKVIVAPPEGHSYARDIAEKYGVTFEMLTEQ